MPENPYKSPEAEGMKVRRTVHALVPAPLNLALATTIVCLGVTIRLTEGKHWLAWLFSGLIAVLVLACVRIAKRNRPATH